jgi:hypothetical protein
MQLPIQTSSLVAILFSMALSARWGPRPLIQFRNHFSQTVGVLGRVISPSQGRYLNTEQHKQNKCIRTPNIHGLSGIRTLDSSVRASEDSSCLRRRGYCDRPSHNYYAIICSLLWFSMRFICRRLCILFIVDVVGEDVHMGYVYFCSRVAK